MSHRKRATFVVDYNSGDFYASCIPVETGIDNLHFTYLIDDVITASGRTSQNFISHHYSLEFDMLSCKDKILIKTCGNVKEN